MGWAPESETVTSMDADDEPTWMYSRRVSDPGAQSMFQNFKHLEFLLLTKLNIT